MHKGQVIKRVVKESGISITQLAAKLGKSRQWLYNVFDSDQVSFDAILEIGKVLHYDFSSDFKQLKKYVISEPSNIAEEESVNYWKQKYIDLLEEYNKLLKSIKR